MIISMIFDLATLVIAFMVFNTATTQVAIYNSPNCTGKSQQVYNVSMIGTVENNCNATCLVLDAQNNNKLYFSFKNKDITCYFNSSNGCASGDFFDFLRMNQSMNASECQPLSLPISPKNETSMSCFGPC